MKKSPTVCIGRTLPVRCAVSGTNFFFSWCFILVCFSNPTLATNFVFDVLYFGNDVAALAPGSDDPTVTTLQPNDTFQWSIVAQGGAFWQVETGGDFFPLMAFQASPAGIRTGDFLLQLFDNGLEVFNFSETGVDTQEVHVGTNSVSLATGLIFDEMRLDYTLIEAVDTDPNDPQPVDTNLGGPLPIFGAPEMNAFSPGIIYVPEPGSIAVAGITSIACIMGRRRRFLV